MSRLGPIVIIEDDEEDMELFESAVRDLGIKNEIQWFPETQSAYEFLQTTETATFLIFCDINLPGRNGLEFKRKIDENPALRKKSIPFMFYSTSAKQRDVNKAYMETVVQGFFQKEHSYGQMKEMLKVIFDYWTLCKHPNAN